ncbi:MAG: hypothetical protein IJE71_05145, partial [Clostridia bacterium]|nr:hypothetical protein [Clostridia bacterium]
AEHQLSQEERMIGTLRQRMMLRMMMSVPGMPCIYYADEAGMEGCADPFCRRTYPWGAEDKQLLAYYRGMIAMRNSNPVLRTGECRYIAPCDSVLGVIRTISGGRDALGREAKDACAVTLINRSARVQEVYLTCEELMGATEIISDRDEVRTARAGAFTVTVPGMHGVTYFVQNP